MATGYQDWRSLTYLQDQSASLYYADTFRILQEDMVETGLKVIDPNGTYYLWNSYTIKSPGRIICLGKLIIFGDL